LGDLVILVISKGFVDFNRRGLPIDWCKRRGEATRTGRRRVRVVSRASREADQALSSSGRVTRGCWGRLCP
jgi:hypothetical protein